MLGYGDIASHYPVEMPTLMAAAGYTTGIHSSFGIYLQHSILDVVLHIGYPHRYVVGSGHLELPGHCSASSIRTPAPSSVFSANIDYIHAILFTPPPFNQPLSFLQHRLAKTILVGIPRPTKESRTATTLPSCTMALGRG